MSFPISLIVNGESRSLVLEDARVTLLDALRERLDLTGSKKGCDRGQCGACTILLDGVRINACLALAVSHDGAAITTSRGWPTATCCTRSRPPSSITTATSAASARRARS